MTELPRKNYSANLDYTSSPKVLAVGAVYTCGAWGRPVGEVLWIGISSHKRRMWLFPHPYCPWMQQKTVQAKGTGVHLRAPCCHKWEWLDFLHFSKCPLLTLSDHFAFPIVSLSPGKKAAGLLFCQPAAEPAAHNQVWHPTWPKFAYQTLLLTSPGTERLLHPPCTCLSLGHMSLLWIPDLGARPGAGGGWCWVSLAHSLCLLPTSNMRKIVIYSLSTKR